jgi:hypothetical protein
MSQMLDNFINGNRSDVRAQLHKLGKRDAILAVIDLLEDSFDRDGVALDDIAATLDDVRRLVEAM